MTNRMKNGFNSKKKLENSFSKSKGKVFKELALKNFQNLIKKTEILVNNSY